MIPRVLLTLALAICASAFADVTTTERPDLCRRVAKSADPAHLRLTMAFVREIGPNVSDSGANHLGVYRIKTAQGWMVLKTRYEPRDTTSMGIQEVLAEEGLAPRLHGIIDGRELRAAAPRFMEADEVATPQIMVQGEVMEEIPGAWNVTHSPYGTPIGARKWDRKKMLAKIDLIERRLLEQKIVLEEPQIGISAGGEPYLLDLDGATYSPRGVPNQLREVRAALIKKLDLAQ